MSPQQLKKLLDEIDQLLAALPASQAVGGDPLNPAMRKRIEQVEARVNQLVVFLDPVRQPKSVFDPAHPAQIGRFVALAMLAQQRVPLEKVARFYGSGIYALYYKGPFPHYSPLRNSEHPIYVGKADPKDTNAATAKAQGTGLHGRLLDHGRSILKADTTLRIEDFECRYLVVQSGWQTAAEDYLINLFKPVWNNETKIVFGIGKHGDSAETRGNKRSPWDTLHPGRSWAGNAKLADQKDGAQISSELKAHFSTLPPYKTVEKIIRKFMDDMRQA